MSDDRDGSRAVYNNIIELLINTDARICIGPGRGLVHSRDDALDPRVPIISAVKAYINYRL